MRIGSFEAFRKRRITVRIGTRSIVISGWISNETSSPLSAAIVERTAVSAAGPPEDEVDAGHPAAPAAASAATRSAGDRGRGISGAYDGFAGKTSPSRASVDDVGP